MAELHMLPGVERRDLLASVPAKKLFSRAIECGVTDATIVGRARDGSFYLTSCLGDADRMVGMLHRAITLVSSSTLNNDVIDTKEL